MTKLFLVDLGSSFKDSISFRVYANRFEIDGSSVLFWFNIDIVCSIELSNIYRIQTLENSEFITHYERR